MNFLNKARRKVEEAVNEVRTAAQQAAQSQAASPTGPQPQQQYYPPPQSDVQWNQTPANVSVGQSGSFPPPPQPFGTSTSQQHQPQSPQWSQPHPQSQSTPPNSYPPPRHPIVSPPESSQWSQQYLPAQTSQPTSYQPRQSEAIPPQSSQWSQQHPRTQAAQSTTYPPPPRQPIGTTSQSSQWSQAQTTPPEGANFPPPPPQQGTRTFQQPGPIQQPFPVPSESPKCLAKDAKFTKYTQFFVLKAAAAESFGACKHCYQSEIVPHQTLAYEFKPYQTTKDDTRFLCDFSIPTPRSIFKTQCVPRNNIQPLLDFVKLIESSALAACDGSIIKTPGPYYTTKLQAIPNFAVCPTCFEILLRHTPFQDKFESIPDGTYGGTNEWSCDLAEPFYKRLLMATLETESPDFISFAEESRARMAIPECPGPGKSITQFVSDAPLVFSARNGKTGNFCFACYCDCVSNTSLEDAFVPAKLSEDQLGKTTCDLAEPYSKLAFEFAIKKADDQVWRGTVGQMGKVGSCRGKAGTDDAFLKDKEQIGELANWYCLNEAPSIVICPHCYWLKVQLFDAAHVFSPVPRPAIPPGVLMCYLTGAVAPPDASTHDCNNFEDSMAWRGRRLFNCLELGYEARDWSQLIAVGKTISTELPACGGSALGFKRASGRKWFGRIRQNSADPDDCTLVFCEECHARAVKGAPYESHYSNDLTEPAYQAEGTTGFPCQTYTNRSRGMLREAAQTGNFAQFAHWWNHRDMLRQKKDMWQPLIQQQLLKMQMANVQQSNQMMLKMNAQRNALQAIGSAGMVELAGSDTGERWGNSQVGTDHWTKASADAEQQWQNASNMKVGSGAGNFGLMGETQRLFMLAQQDENAFKAVE